MRHQTKTSDLNGAQHMFVEKNLTKAVPLAGGGEQKAFGWLALLAAFRAWLFLAILLATFEIWARVAYGGSFVFNPLNVKSIALFTVTPLLLGLGQTFVIISGGIDLSVGFTMGLSAVLTAHVYNWAAQFGHPGISLVVAVGAGVPRACLPWLINGLLLSGLHMPNFI